MRKNAKVKSEPTLIDNRILKIDDVSKMLKLSESTIYRFVRQKKIPYRKVEGTLFFIQQEIFDWVNQGVA